MHPHPCDVQSYVKYRFQALWLDGGNEIVWDLNVPGFPQYYGYS